MGFLESPQNTQKSQKRSAAKASERGILFERKALRTAGGSSHLCLLCLLWSQNYPHGEKSVGKNTASPTTVEEAVPHAWESSTAPLALSAVRLFVATRRKRPQDILLKILATLTLQGDGEDFAAPMAELRLKMIQRMLHPEREAEEAPEIVSHKNGERDQGSTLRKSRLAIATLLAGIPQDLQIRFRKVEIRLLLNPLEQV